MKRKLEEFGELSPAEMRVRDEVHLGEFVMIGDGKVPPEDVGPNRQIRAEFIRYLCLGACDALPRKVPETGVQISGARITGELNLEGAKVEQNIQIVRCRVDEPPNFQDSRLKNVSFIGSNLPGLVGDRLQAEGNMFLCEAKVAGEFRISGAKLGGDLDCENSEFRSNVNALVCHGLQTGGNVFLRNAEIKGKVALMDANLGGNLDGDSANLNADEVSLGCDRMQVKGGVYLRGTTAKGEIRLIGAAIGGDLSCKGSKLTKGSTGDALDASRANVDGALFLQSDDQKNPVEIEGRVIFVAAQFATISDSPDSWPKKDCLLLDRCQYGAFIAAPTTAKERIDWLTRLPASPFRPQPWEQCASVLREMGHGHEAKRILTTKDSLQRKDHRKRLRASSAFFLWIWSLLWDAILASTIRYGRRPLFAVWWLMGFSLLGGLVFQYAQTKGVIQPNNSSILISEGWRYCAANNAGRNPATGERAVRNETPMECYFSRPDAIDHQEFHPLMYSVDTLLPILTFGEHSAFSIVEYASPPIGYWALRYYWFQIAMGWALSLLAVAGFSGLVKSD